MPSIARSSLVQLAGFSANIVASELIGGETWTSDVVFSRPVGRTVAQVAGPVITFAGGDNSVFTLGQFLSFDDDPNDYQIIGITATTVTLVTSPLPRIQGDVIYQSFNLDPATTFQFRATEYTTSGVTESRGTLDLGRVAPKVPSNNLNFDANVIPIDLTKSWVRLALPATAFASSSPPLGDTPDGVTYVIFAGFVSLNQPAGAVSPTQNPATTDIQRFVWLISSKLSV